MRDDVFMTAPPSPGMLNMSMEMPLPMSHYGTTGSSMMQMAGQRMSASPPPPPLPVDDDSMDSQVGAAGAAAGNGRGAGGGRRVMPTDESLPGWVPKDYIEKGDPILMAAIEIIYSKLMIDCHDGYSVCCLRLLC